MFCEVIWRDITTIRNLVMGVGVVQRNNSLMKNSRMPLDACILMKQVNVNCLNLINGNMWDVPTKHYGNILRDIFS